MAVKQQTNDAPLEDIMVAMDVVDTLRHEQSIADRELDQAGRRERLLLRLRELYAAQGIEVPDHVLQQGIDALEQERFSYTPLAPSWRTRLAHIWVSRTRWSKPLGFLAVMAGLFYGIYFAVDVWPQQRLLGSLPQQIESSLTAINSIAKVAEVKTQASDIANTARALLDANEVEQAQGLIADLDELQTRLQQSYSVRVVSRANQNSGIWRRPPDNPDGRNYYLIVEAINNANTVLELPILNEENNTRVRTKTWGLRVSESTFYKVAADKRDDGIIQGNKVGEKKVGFLEPEFSIATTGATITEW